MIKNILFELESRLNTNIPSKKKKKKKNFNTPTSLLGEGNGNPLQYCCLDNPMDRGAWWVTVHGVAKSQTRLSN